MTNEELKDLKASLWKAADMLRSSSHLAANKYSQPILGLIFLRYADILYKANRAAIEAEYNQYKGSRMEKSIKEIAIAKCGFYLPECAYYDYINTQPDNATKATLVEEAMEAIEAENKQIEGILPKSIYHQLTPEDHPELLSEIIRIFTNIPENTSIDIFGEIYEYFLGKFALAEGQGGGVFYTPSSVVRYMVEVLDPKPGSKKFLDAACGSGGMFVQAARYMHNHNATETELMNFRCYGVEKDPDTVKLAKMNLLLNNVRGEINEANSFYSDPYSSVGGFDYVMANPPFNVDEVSSDKVLSDTRFNTYGVPQNKSKGKKGSAKDTVPNANYLWIGLFATALNATGKAGFVMANSASDASNSEYEIRKKIIDEGIVSQMVTLPGNMFSTVTLPATLWFLDKEKTSTPRKNEILFVDARNIFTVIDRSHRKFSDEQIKNLGLITKLYHGDTEAYTNLLKEYAAEIVSRCQEFNELNEKLKNNKYQFNHMVEKESITVDFPPLTELYPLDCTNLVDMDAEALQNLRNQAEELIAMINSSLKVMDGKRVIGKQPDEFNLFMGYTSRSIELSDEIDYFISNMQWIKERFPTGAYNDVVGLCKVATLEGEDGIIEQDYSLNPGRYVGVQIENDGLSKKQFREEMYSLDAELTRLNQEARKLEDNISEKLKELLGEK